MNKLTNISSQNLIFALAFSLGLGMFKLSSLLIALVMMTLWGNFRKLFGRIKIGGWLFLVLTTLFLFTYWSAYTPYKPELFSMEANYFEMLVVLALCAIMMPFFLIEKKNSILLIGYLCAGAFTWAALTVLASQLFSDPPYYGKIVDLRALARGAIKFGNSPGIASLLIFWPSLFFASLIFYDQKRSYWFWVILVGGCFLALLDATLIQQRSFFIIAFLLQPLLVGCFAYMLGRKKTAYCLMFAVAIYPIMLVVNAYIGFLGRKIDAEIFFDARIQMFKYWLYQATINPFEAPVVGPNPWNMLQHFHNFFADIHRISGVWALVLAIMVIAFIFLRLIYLIRLHDQSGFYLLAIAFSLFLIMVSSVVPEGEKQPFLALLLIGSISEVLISSATEMSKSVCKCGCVMSDG